MINFNTTIHILKEINESLHAHFHSLMVKFYFAALVWTRLEHVLVKYDFEKTQRI